jgi:hypothetical protein
VWDLVGNNFDMQAVLNPASTSPNAAYTGNNVVTYSETSASSSYDNGVIGVVDDCVVTFEFLKSEYVKR